MPVARIRRRASGIASAADRQAHRRVQGRDGGTAPPAAIQSGVPRRAEERTQARGQDQLLARGYTYACTHDAELDTQRSFYLTRAGGDVMLRDRRGSLGALFKSRLGTDDRMFKLSPQPAERLHLLAGARVPLRPVARREHGRIAGGVSTSISVARAAVFAHRSPTVSSAAARRHAPRKRSRLRARSWRRPAAVDPAPVEPLGAAIEPLGLQNLVHVGARAAAPAARASARQSSAKASASLRRHSKHGR